LIDENGRTRAADRCGGDDGAYADEHRRERGDLQLRERLADAS
jgi:hypothetical protein